MRWTSIILASLLAGCQPQRSADSAQSETPPQGKALDLDYAAWPSVTEKPYRVGHAFITFCNPLTPDQLRQQETQRKEHGPHAESAIVVRVNPDSLEQFRSEQSVPVGTVVIKEKYYHYAPNVPPVAVGAMIKREPGYDPEHGDWEYAYEQSEAEPGQKIVRGKIASCIECHQGAQATDYLFRSYLRASW